MNETKILGCPFCGSVPIIKPWHGGGPRKRRIVCSNEYCEVRPSVAGTTRGKAIAYWNTRHQAEGPDYQMEGE